MQRLYLLAVLTTFCSAVQDVRQADFMPRSSSEEVDYLDARELAYTERMLRSRAFEDLVMNEYAGMLQRRTDPVVSTSPPKSAGGAGAKSGSRSNMTRRDCKMLKRDGGYFEVEYSSTDALSAVQELYESHRKGYTMTTKKDSVDHKGIIEFTPTGTINIVDAEKAILPFISEGEQTPQLMVLMAELCRGI